MVVTAPDDTSNDLFSRVSLGRISGMIVEQIRLVLRQGKLKPGDRLPTERQLCETFGVSRVTVREALRVLEANGLVEIRVGAHGGAFVTLRSADRVSAGLADLVQLSPLTATEVTEARMVFELGIVPLVVKRSTIEDLADLRTMCQEQEKALENDAYTMALSAAFHERIAECTHNAAMSMLIRSFHGPLLGSLEQARKIAPSMGHRGAREHLEFVKAIERRDVDGATRIMSRHLRRTADRVTAEAPETPTADTPLRPVGRARRARAAKD